MMNRAEKLRWDPAIYEHKAGLIGRRPAEVSRSADLLLEALWTEHRVYAADWITVGVDIYNLEAEACGARLTDGGLTECPDVATPLFSLTALPAELDLPDLKKTGRFTVMLEAAQRLREQGVADTTVRVAASGPATIAAKLVGTSELVLSLAMQDGQAERLLRFTTALAGEWLRTIREAGLEAAVFDSLAAPPIFSPMLYQSAVAPLHRELMTLLETSGQIFRPLIIGGETTMIASSLARTGANWLICDFPVPAAAFAKALASWPEARVRRNLRPADLTAPNRLASVTAAYAADLACFPRPVGGTGILPYDFNPDRFLNFRTAVEAKYRSVSQ